MKGVLTKVHPNGYGFIRVRGLRDQVFVHASDLPDGRPLTVGQVMTFDPISNDKGLRATNVSLRRLQREPKRTFTAAGAVIAVLLAVVIVGAVGWHWLVAWLIAISATTFGFYGLDKILSKLQDRIRVPELTLHVLTLAGGTIGAVAGQRAFRHKTTKAVFQQRFWLIVTVQIIAVALVAWSR